jgi:type II secretory pathway predicted ATPase ExeA
MEITREEVRKELRIYMAHTGTDLGQIASQTGFGHRSLIQFASGAKYGAGDGAQTAAALKTFMDAHPWQPPELPGCLHETAATREMDDLIAYCGKGRWATLYGPAGAQKSFLLEYRAAEAARKPEPRLLWIPIPGRMTPPAILRRIAAAVSASYAQSADGLRQNIIYALKARQSPVVLALDECDLMERDIDTLEVVRRLGDLLRGKLGLIVAGNEQIVSLFKPRQGRYFEQWRSRIEQKELRVLGPTREEARGIVVSELGDAPAEKIGALLDDCTVTDPLSRKKYINARRMFFAIDNIRERRERRKAN